MSSLQNTFNKIKNDIKKDFTPKFFIVLKEGIKKEQLIKDVFAGIITGIVAISLFGQAQEFVEYLSKGDKNKKYIILNMRRVPFIDATGLHRLKDIINTTFKEKRMIVLIEMNEGVKKIITENLDNEKFLYFDNFDEAVSFINKFTV